MTETRKDKPAPVQKKKPDWMPQREVPGPKQPPEPATDPAPGGAKPPTPARKDEAAKPAAPPPKKAPPRLYVVTEDFEGRILGQSVKFRKGRVLSTQGHSVDILRKAGVRVVEKG